MNLLLFAAVREAAGCRHLELQAATVGEALQMAAHRFGPNFEELLPQCAVFLDEARVPPASMWETPVSRGSEVAILPPVSGGALGDDPEPHHGDHLAVVVPVKVAILTVSDRSALGQRQDESGPALERLVSSAGWALAGTATIPDDTEAIQAALRFWSDDSDADLILTTGGTGLGPRDVTPEATQAVLERETPGIPEMMRREGVASTLHAALSRQVAGQRGRTLIVNLPGSPRAATECLGSVLPLVPHAIALIRERPAP